ncbi:glycosyltransferase family 4 protein [Fictibacillus aquaticus]|uniref:Undecaprenyl-phosphate alpha-N-acetylglucosaminyl 1-phosphate transferase n=1 Tax=Fictibacillus aquaticus TaxID=2021314 RepID=A0A235FGB2_9BACL|nr:MraY family glycosyltransferase [Fictibacillus aquaticus]OYD59765.1 undecaprenyl-phosphate alpha-N-acetylglucosaminyl 1-phosphate transferase [Fictibacillus aquaticus]
MLLHYLLTLAISFGLSIILTPYVIKLSYKIGAVDKPNKRKVHDRIVPRLGGLAIYGGIAGAFLYILSVIDLSYSILIASTVIVATGIIDDRYNIRPWQKLLGQMIATVIVLADGFSINYITIPFTDGYSLEVSSWMALPISFIWIIGITNAINLIDGLDGLAAGVSAIAAFSIFTIAVSMGNIPVALISLAILGSTSGFLFFNFNPAKIFMGDTGSLLLGFLLAVLSVMGFKQVTFVTLIIPIIILAVPITDTLIAIVRRKVNKMGIMDADKNHLHHRLLASGFTHKQAVLFIYFIASVFGTAAVFLNNANLLSSMIVYCVLLLIIELLIEKLCLISQRYKPLISLYDKVKVVMVANNDNNKFNRKG